MKKLIVGNWKCFPASVGEAEELFKASDGDNVVVCPSFVFLETGRSILKAAKLGAQDVFWNEGAFTGEVPVSQLKSLGVEYVIVGHSERRALGETDDIVSKKLRSALAAGIKAIICVGEPASVKNEGRDAVSRFISLQVGAVQDAVDEKMVTFAYEPLWAIGTRDPATPEVAAEYAALIRSCCGVSGVKVIYGGSVSPDNAAGFLERDEIDGLLVGGASVDPRAFSDVLSVSGKIS